MKKITILALEDCSKCNTLIQELSNNNIKFEVKHCNNYGGLCDEIEFITDSFSYPIVIIAEKKPIQKSGYTVYSEDNTILYFSKTYESTSNKIKLNQTYSGINVMSLTEMFNKTKAIYEK